MTTTTPPEPDQLPALPTEVVPGVRYPARITNLKTGGRRDIEVTDPGSAPVEAFKGTDIISRLRQFFDALEAESVAYAHDPVALTNAHARMEALLADVRYVRDTIRDRLAERLKADKIRRLTVSGVATVEGTGSVQRSGWQSRDLLAKLLDILGWRILTTDGEVVASHAAADLLLAQFTVEWKLTPLRDAGINPDDYCTVTTDDYGKATATPAVRMVDNHVRRLNGGQK